MREIRRAWNPVRVFFGSGSSGSAGEVLANAGKKKVFFVADGFLYDHTSIIKDIASTLDSAGVSYDLYTAVEPEPSIKVAEAIAAAVRDRGYDSVLGVGGGSVMDMSKVAAALASNGGDPSKYLGSGKFIGGALEITLIPTTAGTGSEVTNRAMVTADEKAVFADDGLYAARALVDPALTVSLPPKVTADTALDALSHSIEGILSDEEFDGVESVEADGYRAVGLIHENLKQAVLEGRSLEIRERMMMASLLSGFVLSRKAMIYGHSLAYPFAPRYHIPHGRSTAMALPYVMEFCMPNGDSRIKLAAMGDAMALGGGSTPEKAQAAVDAVKELVHGTYNMLGVPYTLKSIGVPMADIPGMAELCLARWPRKTSPIQASTDDLRGIYEKMYGGE